MSNEDDLVRLIRARSTALSPSRPALDHRLRDLLRVPLPRTPRAILFDVYGTLFISGSGEVGTATKSAEPGRNRALACEAAWHDVTANRLPERQAIALAGAWEDEVRSVHAARRSHGVAHPEVDAVEVWRQAISRGVDRDPDRRVLERREIERFAVLVECATNPVWPMPGGASMLRRVATAGILMGIVSNAQFYTPLLFPALLGSSLETLGFDASLLAFSWTHRIAKPDPRLFDAPLASLGRRGIDSSQVVYVGNDVRNDIWCACQRGCMTVLFAGDARSLRTREDDAAFAGTEPDSVIDSLGALPEIAGLSQGEP